MLTSGGEPGKRLEGLLTTARHPHRRCLRSRGKSAPTSRLLIATALPSISTRAGPEMTKAEVARIEKTLRETLPHATWLMLCGSLPPGVPPSFYEKIDRDGAAEEGEDAAATPAGTPCGRASRRAQPSSPPIRHEAEHLLGRTICSPARTISKRRSRSARWVRNRYCFRSGAAARSAHSAEGLVRSAASASGRGMSHRRRRCAGGRVHAGRWTARPIPPMRCVGEWRPEPLRRGCPASLSPRSQQTQDMYSQVEVRRVGIAWSRAA